MMKCCFLMVCLAAIVAGPSPAVADERPARAKTAIEAIDESIVPNMPSGLDPDPEAGLEKPLLAPHDPNVCKTLDSRDCSAKCKKGSAESCYKLGRIYRLGQDGKNQDDLKAAKFYQRACKGGYPAACSDLGYLAERGLSGKASEKKRPSIMAWPATAVTPWAARTWRSCSTRAGALPRTRSARPSCS